MEGGKSNSPRNSHRMNEAGRRCGAWWTATASCLRVYEYSVISLECRGQHGAFVDFVYRTICNKMNEKSEKSAKKRRVMQRFRTEYSVQYPVIRKLATDCHHAFCTVCSADKYFARRHRRHKETCFNFETYVTSET